MRFVLAAGLTATVVLTGLGMGSAAADSPARGGSAGAAPGSVLWSSAQTGVGHDIAAGGHMVFAVGATFLAGYDAATGSQVWENGQGGGLAVAASPDGRRVYVVKAVHGTTMGADIFTAAYNGSTGQLLWSALYQPKYHGARPVTLALTPDGRSVFVLGRANGRTSRDDFVTLAYAAASGKQLWVARYSAPGGGEDFPGAMAVSPGGSAVYVTGSSVFSGSSEGFSTIAYSTVTGRALWTRRYLLPHRALADPASVAVSRNGKRLWVVGFSIGPAPQSDSTFIVAYAAGSGTQLWVRRNYAVFAGEVLASPLDGGTVIVPGGTRHEVTVVVAYSATTGRQKWISRFAVANFRHEILGAAALSPDGRSFYLAGLAGMTAPFTVAASVATGSQAWSQTVHTGRPGLLSALGIPIGMVVVNPADGTVYTGMENFTVDPHPFDTVALQP
jgi:PQQ-like domain